ncbi:MAG: CRISPR-associated helicase Cas3', partial [Ruminococcus sp.]
PTGGGKTLSSLRFAVNSCINHGMDKIIYTAPYMSILEQNSEEIRLVTGEEYFIEHHSNALMDENNAEELAEYELRTEKWDLPVVATTLVQFLNALFSGKMQAVRRMHRLVNSVIIIDEVQSVPVKCVNIFNLAMNFLSAVCRCTIVLCSATQPVFENTEYPLILDDNQSVTGDYKEDFEIFKRTEIIPKIEGYGMTYEETAEFCRREYEKAGNLLLIVNTKNSARRIYEIMKEISFSDSPKIIHLSTNMCPEHRCAMIKEMRESMGNPLICITTQLIEAGVDISFKCVVRSLAGLDNAAQAAGRCNRHGENPEPCPVYMINIKDENLDKLKEIKNAKKISRNIIDSYKGCDCSSPGILAKYYELLFREVKNELNYNIKNSENADLINLLSLNSHRNNKSLKSEDYSKSNMYLAQAFKTAGDSFDVIDAETIGILVPYNNEAIEMINALESDIDSEKARKILRKAQKYTVSVYQGMFELLKQKEAVYQTKSKTNPVYVLRAANYDKELGIKTESSSMEFLDY